MRVLATVQDTVHGVRAVSALLLLGLLSAACIVDVTSESSESPAPVSALALTSSLAPPTTSIETAIRLSAAWCEFNQLEVATAAADDLNVTQLPDVWRQRQNNYLTANSKRSDQWLEACVFAWHAEQERYVGELRLELAMEHVRANLTDAQREWCFRDADTFAQVLRAAEILDLQGPPNSAYPEEFVQACLSAYEARSG